MVRRGIKHKKNSLWNFRKYWGLYVVFVFLLARLFLNLDFISEFKILSAFFAIVYLFLIVMLVKRIPFFSTIFILFLTVDSMIGTYLMAIGTLPVLEFYGTMAINFLIIILIMRDVEKNFPR